MNLDDRLRQVESDLTLALRAISHLFRTPGHEGRWSKEDFAALSEVMQRRDPHDPTDWESDPPVHDDLSRPARPA